MYSVSRNSDLSACCTQNCEPIQGSMGLNKLWCTISLKQWTNYIDEIREGWPQGRLDPARP